MNWRKRTGSKMNWSGTVSHELRSPLTYIMGYVDLLLVGEMGELSDEQRKSLEIVANKTKMLTRLVTDILSFRKDAGGRSGAGPGESRGRSRSRS